MDIIHDGHIYSIQAHGKETFVFRKEGGVVGVYQTAEQNGTEYHQAQTDLAGWVSIHENEITDPEEIARWALVQIIELEN